MTFIQAAMPSEDGSIPEDVDSAKALFMTEIARMVEKGHGELVTLVSGTLELRLATGQIYHLGDLSITRIS